MDLFTMLAEEKIRQAVRDGDLNNLPGQGKPLKLDELSDVSEELRTGYKILKNAGFVPEEVQLNKEMLSLKDLISCCYDEEERKKLKKQLNEKTIRFNMLMEKRKTKSSSSFGAYREKIMSRFF
ncbi:DnaJ family domain-containing protein [Bacillus taeanensis]|uniref:DUF1992 domain-containing protein n=1 Tax=Bacillus taeanensis TaxID=273032 RepID=A0A366XYT3_9BACI|nr:DnaJ family domain-containing protein [Bacillus taeanensis]RBW70766.1 DUF1992 domain-containing protein [Bacillus taeanensis]